MLALTTAVFFLICFTFSQTTKPKRAVVKFLLLDVYTKVGVWCIGEYGEHLLETYVDIGGESLDMGGFSSLTQDDVIDMLSTILKAHNSSNDIKAYTLVALAKFATKCTPDRVAIITNLLQGLEVGSSKYHRCHCSVCVSFR